MSDEEKESTLKENLAKAISEKAESGVSESTENDSALEPKVEDSQEGEEKSKGKKESVYDTIKALRAERRAWRAEREEYAQRFEQYESKLKEKASPAEEASKSPYDDLPSYIQKEVEDRKSVV